MTCRISIKCAIGVLAAALALAGVGTSAGRSMRAAPDVTVLIPKAKAKVRATRGFSRAVLLEADGSATHRVTRAAGITHWRFVFDNQSTPRFRFRSAFVNYSGGWGRVVGKRQPFLEDLRIPTTPRMTLGRAIVRLRAAHYRSGFFNVTLRRPLTSDNRYKNPLYIFGFGTRARVPYVAVDTRTGRVTKIS